MRDHLDQLVKQTGKNPEALGITSAEKELDGEIPFAGEFLWSWFWELHQGRGNNGFGPNPLSWTEMEAWSQITKIQLTPFEALTFRAMDNAFLAALNRKQKKKSGKNRDG